ncbi:hypothetical protein ACFQX6_62565 [Streptosporangium lutulentum]
MSNTFRNWRAVLTGTVAALLSYSPRASPRPHPPPLPTRSTRPS